MKTRAYFLLLFCGALLFSCSKPKENCICPEIAAPLFDLLVAYPDTLLKANDSLWVYQYKNKDFTGILDSLLLLKQAPYSNDTVYHSVFSYPSPIKSVWLRSKKLNIDVKITDLMIQETQGRYECCGKSYTIPRYTLVQYKQNDTIRTQQPLHLKKGK